MEDNDFDFDLLINIFRNAELYNTFVGQYCKNDVKLSAEKLISLKNRIYVPAFEDNHRPLLKQIDLCLELLNNISNAKNSDEEKILKETYNKEIVRIPFYDSMIMDYYSEVNSLNNINTSGFIRFKLDYKSNNIGGNLIEFLSYDINNFEDFLLLFINYPNCLLDQMTKSEQEKIKSETDLPFSYINDLCKKYYDSTKSHIQSIQNLYKSIIAFVYNINENIDFKGLYNIQKYQIYNYIDYYSTYNLFNNKYVISNPIDKEHYTFSTFAGKPSIENIDELIDYMKTINPNNFAISSINYHAKDLYTAFYISLSHLIDNNNLFVKKCKNCNRYFITSKNNVVYCDRVITENNETCKDIGNKLSQKRKEQDETVYGKYRSIYAKKAMLVKRNPDITRYKKDYEKWKKEAKAFMTAIKNNEKKYDEFDKWLEENK